MIFSFGTPINFLIGNHTPCVVTEDAFEYVLHGLRTIGAPITYSMNVFRGDAINIIMEGCDTNTARGLADLRRRYSESRFYMITTEILTPGGFNSANTVHRLDGDHYSDETYWSERSKSFHILLPVLDGLIFMAESLFEGYNGLNLPSHYLPLAALPGYSVIQREPEAARDIDIFFSGTVTDYRAAVLNALREKGFHVFEQAPQYPEYLRRHFLARSKLAIGLRLSEMTQFTSKQRAHYYLVNRIPHVFEATPDHTDLHEFIQCATPGSAFLDRCHDLLNGMHAFPDETFERFRQSPHLDPASVFREFHSFLRR